jgi:hypothetical protein
MTELKPFASRLIVDAYFEEVSDLPRTIGLQIN